MRAFLFMLAFVPVLAFAQDDGCEPLTKESASETAKRLSLDAEQTAWLLLRVEDGRLRSPGDLEEMPGAGVELLETLEAAWCWVSPAGVSADAMVRTKPEGFLREGRASLALRALACDLRARADPAGASVVRGGIRAGWGATRVLAGSLKARTGMGLLLATPGMEPRGGVLPDAADAGWRTALGVDEGTLVGIAAAQGVGSFEIESAVAKDRQAGNWGTLSLGRNLSEGWGRAVVLYGARSLGAAFSAGGHAGPGRWSTEVARSGDGVAAAGTWAVTQGPIRVRAGLSQVGAGFQVPAVRTHRIAMPDGSVRWHLEARWQGGPSRHVTVAATEGRDPDAKDWALREAEQALEAGERLAPGLRFGFVWRHRRENAEGAGPESEEISRLARFEIALERRGWRVLGRLEERSSTGSVSSRLTTVRAGRTGKHAWELRAALSRKEPLSPDLWWYRRRAGGAYGWDRLDTGSWIGAWARLAPSSVSLEVSVDAVPRGWEAAFAFRFASGE